MKLLEILRKNVDGEDIDQLIMDAQLLNLTIKGYEERNLHIPEKLIDKVGEINSFINNKVRNERQIQLKKLKARRLALATADEKRAMIDQEIGNLEKLIE